MDKSKSYFYGDLSPKSAAAEKVLPNGNIVAYACGEFTGKRYINDKIEQELVEFKQEIEEKFAESEMNKTYRFPKVAVNSSNISQNNLITSHLSEGQSTSFYKDSIRLHSNLSIDKELQSPYAGV